MQDPASGDDGDAVLPDEGRAEDVQGPMARTGTMARILGLSEVHLGRLANSGSIPRPVKRGEWDVIATVQAYVDYMVKQAKGGEEANSELKSEELKLLTARRRRAEANAVADEINSDQALKAVVLRHEAEAAMASFCMVLKTGLGNAASRIASRATAMSGAVEIQDLAETEMNRAFVAARADLEKIWADDGDGGEGAG